MKLEADISSTGRLATCVDTHLAAIHILDDTVHTTDARAGRDLEKDEAIITPASAPRVLDLPVVVVAVGVGEATLSSVIISAGVPPLTNLASSGSGRLGLGVGTWGRIGAGAGTWIGAWGRAWERTRGRDRDRARERTRERARDRTRERAVAMVRARTFFMFLNSS